MKLIYPYGATPLDVDESEGLIPQHLTLQSQLNEWEQANITQAEIWLGKKNIKDPQKILKLAFLLKLHKKMFDHTWRWAGHIRKSNKNIGIDWHLVSHHLQILLEDVIFQIKHASYDKDEIAARFHHRLVAIHAFANGNGRHARLATDALLIALAQPRFTWGKTQLTENTETRKTYIQALRLADRGDYANLLKFIERSGL